MVRSAQESINAEATDVLPPSDDRPTRRRVLVAALELFAERGYAGTSIRDVATAMNIRSSSLYDQFPSKEHILARIIEIGMSSWCDAMTAALADADPDPVAQVRAAMDANIRSRCRYPLLSRTVDENTTRLAPELAAPSISRREDLEHRIVRVVVDGVESKVFDVPNVATALYATASMAQRVPYWFTPSKDFTVDDLIEDYTELALRVLGARSPG